MELLSVRYVAEKYRFGTHSKRKRRGKQQVKIACRSNAMQLEGKQSREGENALSKTKIIFLMPTSYLLSKSVITEKVVLFKQNSFHVVSTDD